MQLNENSWHARLYKVMHEYPKLPENLCNYFWKLVLIVLTLPLYFPGLLIRIRKDTRDTTRGSGLIVGGLIINAILFSLSACVYSIHTEKNLSLLLSIIIVFIGIPAAIALLLAVVYLIDSGVKEIQNKKQDENSIVKITSEYIKAKKENYCPRIEWKKYENSKRNNTE